MAEKLIIDSYGTIDPELELVVDEHLNDAFEYLAAIDSGLDVENEHEIFSGEDTFDDSQIMGQLRSRLMANMELDVTQGSLYFEPPQGSRRRLVEVFHGKNTDLVCLYDLDDVDLDKREDAVGYSLRLAKPSQYKENGAKR